MRRNTIGNVGNLRIYFRPNLINVIRLLCFIEDHFYFKLLSSYTVVQNTEQQRKLQQLLDSYINNTAKP